MGVPAADWLEDPLIVRDDDGRPVRRDRQAAQEFHHRLAALLVERTGWLVADHELWLVHERPRNRDPLLLPAGKLGWRRVRHPAVKPHLLEKAGRPLHRGTSRRARQEKRGRGVLGRRQRGDQIECLKDEAKVPPPKQPLLAPALLPRASVRCLPDALFHHDGGHVHWRPPSERRRPRAAGLLEQSGLVAAE